MTNNRDAQASPWLATALTGCAFFYFLIFAQFGFLNRLNELESSQNLIEMAMLAMGLGGITGSVWSARKLRLSKAKSWTGSSFIVCGLAGLFASSSTSIWALVANALFVGLALGALTVSIVPILRALIPEGRIGSWVSLAVGGAYFLSNVPPLFRLQAIDHCLLGAFACCIGAVATLRLPQMQGQQLRSEAQPPAAGSSLFETKGVSVVTLLLLGLIWLDSAAFYVIQNTEPLKAASWSSDSQLWTNAVVHFAVALLAGLILDRGRLFELLLLAFALLVGGAYLLQHHPGAARLATLLYVAGVSLYSTALVAYGALAAESGKRWSIARRAGMVFAIGGWFGSAMGIGMARDLHAIPLWFLAVALLAASSSALWRFLAAQPSTRDSLA